jgi:hypothetical protein
VDRRTRVFFTLVGAPLVALAAGAAILVVGVLSGRHWMWQPTETDLVTAIRHQSPVATKVFVEALPSIDTPVPFSHPRILNFRQLELAPLAIALLQEHRYMVDILLAAGSDPAKALSALAPETAAALLSYAKETGNALAVEYLTKYRGDPAHATVNPLPATQ